MDVKSVSWVEVRTDQYEAMAGVELIGDRQTGGDGYSWQHFRAPDGKVFELCYDPKR